MNILLCIVFDKSLTNLWQIFDKSLTNAHIKSGLESNKLKVQNLADETPKFLQMYSFILQLVR